VLILILFGGSLKTCTRRA